MVKPRVAVAALKKPAVGVVIGNVLLALVLACAAWYLPTQARAQTISSFLYVFKVPGTLYQAPRMEESSSPYFWLQSGGQLRIANNIGSTAPGNTYFFLVTKNTSLNASAEVYMNRLSDNFPDGKEKNAYNGESIIARFVDKDTFYYAGIRADGYAVIKKKVNGVYTTLATTRVLPGAFSAADPDLIPLTTWMGLKLAVVNDSSGAPQLTLSLDLNNDGIWNEVLSVVDKASVGTPLAGAGLTGFQSDHADMQFDNFKVTSLTDVLSAAVELASKNVVSYDSTVLAAHPMLYLAMSTPSSGKESDKSGHGLNGTYKGGTPALTSLPNGDSAAKFNGTSQYLTVPSNSSLSIPTTKKLTWEAWIKPDSLQFGSASDDGYVDWMGKCEQYSPTCEWEARMYSTITAQNRPSRLSAYVFNQSAGLGSGADWQPAAGVLTAGQWIHVVAEYDLTQTPAECSSAYPGTITIWVNGIKQNFGAHAPTGCVSQYKVAPKAGASPLNIGTMAFDTWFKGAIGKVAVYNRLLTQSEINSHYTAMTGKTPTGACADICML